jgi:5-hydroxyisourate hydrolase
LAEARPTISTHILDVALGRPAVGLMVRLVRLVGETPMAAGSGTTDDDGRIADLLGGAELTEGDYRLEFDLDDDGFFTVLGVGFRVTDPSRSYHVPLIRAPYALSTYRGT